MHGGSTPSGIASPHFKTGRHSRHLPTKLIGRYEEHLNQGAELLPLLPDIALLDTRISELLQRVDIGLTAQIWENAQSAYAGLKKAMTEEDEDKIKECMMILGTALNHADSQGLWADIRDMLQERKGLVDTETKRAKIAQESITLDRLMLVMSAILDIIKQHVSDADTLRYIAADIRKLSVSNFG